MTTDTSYEVLYRTKVNRFLMGLLALHVPAAMVVAQWFGSPMWSAFLVGTALLVVPALLLWRTPGQLWTSVALGASGVGFSALLIYLAQGMIEFHFHAFCMLAMLIACGAAAPILVSLAVIVTHHILFWIVAPKALFHYEASFSIVLLHGAFLAFEAFPACWIAGIVGRALRAQGIVAERLGTCAERMAGASGQISMVSDQLASSSTEQASTLEETAATGKGVQQMAQQNSQSAQSTAQLMDDVSQLVAEANNSIGRMMTEMRAIAESNEKVGKIIRVINDIALRTDILALNASVEAAHAGVAGQRFAVVAGEVGRLATRSAAAAKEISDLISTSITTSKSGQQRLDEVVRVIERITESSGNVKRLVDEVNRGSQDQAYSMSEISRAVNELEKVMNVLASTAQQSAVASREMGEQSGELREIVAELGALSV